MSTRYRMLSTQMGAEDGVTVKRFEEGETYDIPIIGPLFVEDGHAEAVGDDDVDVAVSEEKSAGAAPENKAMGAAPTDKAIIGSVSAKHRGGAFFDIVDSEGNIVEEAIRGKDEAEARAKALNG